MFLWYRVKDQVRQQFERVSDTQFSTWTPKHSQGTYTLFWMPWSCWFHALLLYTSYLYQRRYTWFIRTAQKYLSRVAWMCFMCNDYLVETWWTFKNTNGMTWFQKELLQLTQKQQQVSDAIARELFWTTTYLHIILRYDPQKIDVVIRVESRHMLAADRLGPEYFHHAV